MGTNTVRKQKKEKGSIKQILEASQTSYGVSLNIEDAAITVPLTQDTALIAEMEHRPELAGLDLVAHLGEFLVAIGELSNEDDVWLFEWDCTGLELEEGNGIPDAAEFALLQSVLEDTALNLFRSGGVINSFVYEDWAQNIAQAAVDLPTQTLGIQRAVAAYMEEEFGVSVIDDGPETPNPDQRYKYAWWMDGGLKVATENGWFAARPSGTEDIYKLYAESFRSPEHLKEIVREAQGIVTAALAG